MKISRIKFSLVTLVLILVFSTAISAQTEVTKVIQNAPITSSGQSAAIVLNYVPNANQDYKGTFYTAPDLAIAGFFGATLITTTTTAVGKFHAIQVLEDCVIDSLVSTKLTGNPHSLALSAGTTLLLNGITRVKLASGKVWAYKSE